MDMEQYLGLHVSALLDSTPLSHWPLERYVEEDLDEPRIYYVFTNGVLEILCDGADTTSAIFVRKEQFDGAVLADIPFSATREQALAHFGVPSQSGAKMKDRELGEYGGWDRFSRTGYVVHVEYRTDSNAIRQITYMREVPEPLQ